MNAMRLADIVGSKVIDSNGQTVGHVVDLVLDPGDGFCAMAIEVGSTGWIDRLNVVGTIRRRRKAKGVSRIPWSDIASIEGNRITLHRSSS